MRQEGVETTIKSGDSGMEEHGVAFSEHFINGNSLMYRYVPFDNPNQRFQELSGEADPLGFLDLREWFDVTIDTGDAKIKIPHFEPFSGYADSVSFYLQVQGTTESTARYVQLFENGMGTLTTAPIMPLGKIS